VTALAAALALLFSALECPPGAERRGAAPPEDFEEWCETKDEAGRALRHGPSRRYYDDGGLWLEERYERGEREGPSIELHRNGRKAREGTWAKGARTGRWTVWYASGAVEEEAEWRDGVPHGRFAAFWPTGGKKSEGRRCGGAPCGPWRSWDERGALLGTSEYAEPSLAP
jgi:antitoxin component YwqK of YwqJK toxin-antitoxin module